MQTEVLNSATAQRNPKTIGVSGASGDALAPRAETVSVAVSRYAQTYSIRVFRYFLQGKMGRETGHGTPRQPATFGVSINVGNMGE
jgi:hypothetical protein